MAITPLNWDGTAAPVNLVPAIGSFVPACAFSATVSGTTTSETITFSNLSVIKGALIMVIDTNGEVATADAAVSWSGNVLTLADGGATFDLDASGHTIYGVVWGLAKA